MSLPRRNVKYVCEASLSKDDIDITSLLHFTITHTGLELPGNIYVCLSTNRHRNADIAFM